MTAAQQIKELQAQLKSLKDQVIKKTISKLTSQVGDKGTVNIYGLNKFPICLYPSQIVRLTELLANPEFQQFVRDNMETLEANAARNKAEKVAAGA